jgi:tetratricopeptide (TPR) repeat protein
MTDFSAKRDNIVLIKARALSSAGRMAWFQADFATARVHMEESVALFRQQHDRVGLLDATSTLILVRTWQGELPAALSLLEESMEILKHMPNRESLLPIIAALGRAAIFMVTEESLPHAWVLGKEAERLARATNDKRSLAWALNTLAFCRYYSGDYAAARPELEEGIILFRELGELWGVSLLTWSLGNIARREGRYSGAWMLNQQAMTMQSRQNSQQGLPPMLDSFAYLAIAQGHAQRGARLLAIATKLREDYGSFQQPLVLAEREEYLHQLRAMLDPAELEAVWAEGRVMMQEDAITYALERPDEA